MMKEDMRQNREARAVRSKTILRSIAKAQGGNAVTVEGDVSVC
jgi:hypothetical protein